jgi:hypothetical protein
MSDKSSGRVLAAVNFPTAKEARRAFRRARKVTKSKRGFSKYVRGLIQQDFLKSAT